MRYMLLLILSLPSVCKAQSNVSGLGPYRISITTPDSLDQTAFDEQEQSYVKGTIALPCTHIRTFKSSSVQIEGITVINLSLAFYDNKLFRLSCDYSDDLNVIFQKKHGKGISKLASYPPFCARENNKLLMLRGEIWSNTDILAFVVHTKGYKADCQPEDSVILSISSQRFTALSSDCEIKNTNPFMEEFEKALTGRQPKPESMER